MSIAYVFETIFIFRNMHSFLRTMYEITEHRKNFELALMTSATESCHRRFSAKTFALTEFIYQSKANFLEKHYILSTRILFRFPDVLRKKVQVMNKLLGQRADLKLKDHRFAFHYTTFLFVALLRRPTKILYMLLYIV